LHEKALLVYQQDLIGREVTIPITVLVELSVMTAVYLERTNLQKFLQALNHNTYYLDIFFAAELNNFRKKTANFKLKAMDLSVLICALSNGSELITFDEKLQKVWAKLRSTPK